MISQLIQKYDSELLSRWIELQVAQGGNVDQNELKDHSARFIAALKQAMAGGQINDIHSPAFAGVREILEEVSRTRALRGISSADTATFVLSLKEPLFTMLRAEAGKDADKLATEVWNATVFLDKLALYTTTVYQKSREEVIKRQQDELLELSTPVVQLWDGVLALPLIGTLDSARTQVVMESLLEQIVSSGAEIAIIDITGVPTVDTLVAQHLLKTVAAARLMGADCIISGIRPQIAQTIVHLGVQLNVISKATMADALAVALKRIGKVVVDRKAKASTSAEKSAEEE